MKDKYSIKSMGAGLGGAQVVGASHYVAALWDGRVFGQELVERFLEQLRLSEAFHRVVVAPYERVHLGQCGAGWITAEAVVKVLEFAQGYPAERACRLKKIFHRVAGGRWWNGRDQIHPHEAVDAFVKDLRGHF